MNSAGSTPPTALSGRSGPRSKSGCWTCRERKVKCDESRPICGRCIKAQRQCDYAPREAQRPQNRHIAQPVLLPKVLSAAAIAGKSPKNALVRQKDHDMGRESSVSAPSPAAPSPASDMSSTKSSRAAPTPTTDQITPGSGFTTPTDQIPPGSGFITPADPVGEEKLVCYDNRVLSNFETKFIASLQTKTPKWSFISGIMHLCRDDPTLMHMILAVVGQQISAWEGLEHEQLLAVEHYRRGLANFAKLVGSGDYERHTLVIALWLVAQYELRFAEQARDICRHLEGFNMAIVAHGSDLLPGLSEHPVESPSTATFRLPSTTYRDVVNRLGLWIAYTDSQASTFDLGGTIMHTLSYRWPGSIDRVFAGSRHALHDIWGDAYPASEYEDDQSNRIAFDLFHCGYVLRYKVTEFRRSMRVREGFQGRVEQLRYEINTVSEKYSSLISLAGSWPVKDIKPSRLALNCRFIVSFFHAVELDFYRHAYWYEPLTAPAGIALSRILNITTIVHETEGQNSLSRHSWPLWLAAIETRDVVYQNWIVERLTGLSTYGTNVLRATTMLKAIIEKQRLDPQRVDYLDWLRQGHFEEFVI